MRETTGTVSIKFVNKGATDARFLNIILKKSDDYETISSDNVYIGDLDSDDYETADFKINVKRLKSSKLNIPVHFEFQGCKTAMTIQGMQILSLSHTAQRREGRGEGDHSHQ